MAVGQFGHTPLTLAATQNRYNITRLLATDISRWFTRLFLLVDLLFRLALSGVIAKFPSLQTSRMANFPPSSGSIN